MPSEKIPTNVHAKVGSALDDIAKMSTGVGAFLPVVIVTSRPPDSADLPGVAPTIVTWPDGRTRVQGIDEAPAGAQAGHYHFQVTLKLAPGRQAANEDIVAALASAPGVIAINAADGLTPDLHYAIPEVRARRESIGGDYAYNYDAVTDVAHDGKGVIVGIVDFGLDFAHPNFIDADGKSRVLAIWDQNDRGANPYAPPDTYKPLSGPKWYGEPTVNSLYVNSRVYLRDPATRTNAAFPENADRPAYLNNKVDNANPYANYYDPHKNYYLDPDDSTGDPDEDMVIAHGTHVADIAAGNGRADGCHSGVAPKADIVFVQVRKPDMSTWKVSAADILNAVHFIFTLADNLKKPAVVNLSMNLYSGPHDGSGPWESTLTGLVRNATIDGNTLPRMVVVSAGNAYGLGRHARFVLNNQVEDSIRWKFPADDRTDNYLTLWYNCAANADDKLVVTVRNNNLIRYGEAVQNFNSASPAAKVDIQSNVTGNPVIGTIEARDNLLAAKRSVRITIKPLDASVVPTGAERFVEVILKWDQANTLRRVHGWIERDDVVDKGKGESTFPGNDRSDAETKFDLLQTLGDMACGSNVIAVGAINAPTTGGPGVGAERALLAVSSAGPPVNYNTLDIANNATAGFGTGQPWLVAPGMAVAAARSKGGRPANNPRPLRAIMSGTSMAAPHAAGAVAVLLEKSAGTKGYMDIKNALKDGVFQPSGSWDERYGHGRLDVLGAHGKL